MELNTADYMNKEKKTHFFPSRQFLTSSKLADFSVTGVTINPRQGEDINASLIACESSQATANLN